MSAMELLLQAAAAGRGDVSARSSPSTTSRGAAVICMDSNNNTRRPRSISETSLPPKKRARLNFQNASSTNDNAVVVDESKGMKKSRSGISIASSIGSTVRRINNKAGTTMAFESVERAGPREQLLHHPSRGAKKNDDNVARKDLPSVVKDVDGNDVGMGYFSNFSATTARRVSLDEVPTSPAPQRAATLSRAAMPSSSPTPRLPVELAATAPLYRKRCPTTMPQAVPQVASSSNVSNDAAAARSLLHQYQMYLAVQRAMIANRSSPSR